MTSVYGPAASHERRVKGLEQPGEDIVRCVASRSDEPQRAERPRGEPAGGAERNRKIALRRIDRNSSHNTLPKVKRGSSSNF